MEYVSVFETELGPGIVTASEKGICKVDLPCPGVCRSQAQPVPDAGNASPLTEQAAEMLKLHFKGEPQPFDSIPVDLSSMSDFKTRVLLLIRAIPHGEVKSYGQVAAMAGMPRAFRAIGGALAANPVPIIIPCHRVVGSNGNLTGYSAPGGLHLKKIILLMEHIEFAGDTVHMKKESYKQAKIGMN